MKVAVVTDDGKTISQHFGRARYYQVYEIRDGVVKGSERRPPAAWIPVPRSRSRKGSRGS